MLKIIDFYATWCKPCTVLAKTLGELQDEFPELEIEKVDIEKNPERFKSYDVKSVPFILFEKDGEIVHKFVGNQFKKVLKEVILQYYE